MFPLISLVLVVSFIEPVRPFIPILRGQVGLS